MANGERFFSQMESHKITWHTWGPPEPKALSENEALEIQGKVMAHLVTLQGEMTLFIQERVTRNDYLGGSKKRPPRPTS